MIPKPRLDKKVYRKAGWGLALLPLLLLAACKSSSPSAGQSRRFTEEQLSAKFPADLGPAEVDVSQYPEPQKANYALFAEKCSKCHTLARAINAPFIEEGTWSRYVHRMHGKAQARLEEPLLEGAEARRVIDFLVYDSRERKVKRAQEFMRTQEDLKQFFQEVLAERAHVQEQEAMDKAKAPAPYVGDKR